jgi:hypothetical protein
MMAIRKASLQKSKVKDAHCPWMAETFPVLHEFMTVRVTEGSKTFEPASMTLFSADGVFKACLNDRASSQQLWAAGASLEELLAAMEARLTSEEPDWRPQPMRKPGKGK